METQLIRLEKPYNLICSKRGDFALHIATLIVVDGYEEDINDPTIEYPRVKSYPVVRDELKMMDSVVWSHNELSDCITVCREDDIASISDLARVMRFLDKQRAPHYKTLTPAMFTLSLSTYGISLYMATDKKGKVESSYEVELEFEEGNKGATCMVYSSRKSPLFFTEYFANDIDLLSTSELLTNLEAVDKLVEYRNTYLQALKYKGVSSIKFTTKDEKYQWFVDKLNAAKTDEKGV